MKTKDPLESVRPVNVSVYLREMATQRPYKRAVVAPVGRDKNGRVTYTQLNFQQLDRESDRIARGLNGAGIKRGIRTILMVKPSLEFFVLTFALFKVGAVPVVVDPGMGIKRMLSCFQECSPQAFIGIPLAHVVRTLYPKFFKAVNIWVTVGRRWFWGGLTFDQLREKPWEPFDTADTTRDEIAAILFTTGSTGPAKGAIYTHGNFDAQIRHIQAHFDIGPDEIDLPTFPLFALFDPALGMTAIIPDMDPTKPARVDPQKIIGPIKNHGVTNMFASPALLNRVGSYGKVNGVQLPSLRRVVSAGAPVAPANIEQFSTMLGEHAQIHTPYGATEAVPIISIASREILSETRARSESGFGTCVGYPLENLDIQIIHISDDPIDKWQTALPVPDGEIGEIVVKGAHVTRGYYNNPKADALAKIIDTKNGGFWHRMGDLGWRDKKGRIWFCGRKNHRVETVDGPLYSIPCEAIFNNHPAVFRSALVGVGETPGQEPVMCIELQPDLQSPDKKQIENELLDMAQGTELTKEIHIILF
ncbi:MAG: AMP-binding protein, partial [Desulfobacterales bacterium]|nr:AMP-binding protein [Desulfobacterales bacterium]